PLGRVRLAPFGPEDVAALCASMAGPMPAEAVSAVVRLADGSPFMASAVLRGMVETGALVDTADGWDVDAGPMGDVQTSRRGAAEPIEGRATDRAFELAYHFDAAGDPARALPYALQSAELARSRHALEVAITHYRIAERAVDTGAVDTGGEGARGLEARIAEGLGDVLTLKGEYAEASRLFTRALARCDDPVGRAVLDGKLGDVAFKTGDQALARGHLEGALRDLGGRVPRAGVAMVVAALKEMLVQALHTMAPRLFLARRRPDGAEREFLAIRIYSRLAYVYWFSAGKVPCAWAHLREMNLAERYPPTRELAQAYSEHAPVMTMAPLYARGIRYAQRSLAIRRELGDVWGQGQSLSFSGAVLYAASRYRDCIDQCR